ncbi:hypothetical protein F5Y07DRAFT_401256 [Xylaria sp. FL0933]|nr:hypothetical protein F5Y07DRAFT_401256 [Xylaria sp. FL0933]
MLIWLYILIGLMAISNATPTLNLKTEEAEEVDGFENGTVVAEGVIANKQVGCWRHSKNKYQLNYTDLDIAKLKLKDWGALHKLGPASYHGEQHGVAAVWVCNCKHFHDDHVVPKEQDEAEYFIQKQCGPRGGWVWSKKWQKRINFGAARLMHSHELYSGKCPKYCLWTLQ